MNPKLQRFSQRPNNRNLSNEDLMRRFLIEERQREEMEMWRIQIAESQSGRGSSSVSSGGGGSQSSSSPSPASFTETGLLLNYDVSNSSSYPGSGNTLSNLVVSTGSTYNQIIYNGPAYSSSNGGILVLDGSDDFLAASSTINIFNSYGSQPPSLFNPSTTPFTMGVWLNPGSLTGTLPIFDIAGNGAGSMIMIFDNLGRFRFIHRQTFSWSNYSEVGTPNGTVNPNQWYYAVYSNSGGTAKFYLNGNLVYSAPQIISQAETYHIAFGIFLDYHSVGTMSLGAGHLYNIELSSEQILSNFNYSKSKYGL